MDRKERKKVSYGYHLDRKERKKFSYFAFCKHSLADQWIQKLSCLPHVPTPSGCPPTIYMTSEFASRPVDTKLPCLRDTWVTSSTGTASGAEKFCFFKPPLAMNDGNTLA